jgi:hypothetical protein
MQILFVRKVNVHVRKKLTMEPELPLMSSWTTPRSFCLRSNPTQENFETKSVSWGPSVVKLFSLCSKFVLEVIRASVSTSFPWQTRAADTSQTLCMFSELALNYPLVLTSVVNPIVPGGSTARLWQSMKVGAYYDISAETSKAKYSLKRYTHVIIFNVHVKTPFQKEEILTKTFYKIYGSCMRGIADECS